MKFELKGSELAGYAYKYTEELLAKYKIQILPHVDKKYGGRVWGVPYFVIYDSDLERYVKTRDIVDDKDISPSKIIRPLYLTMALDYARIYMEKKEQKLIKKRKKKS